MEKIRIIDAHTHVFPDKIAVKASESIGRFYDIPMNRDGRIDTLVQLSTNCCIERSVIFSTATRADQVQAINTFIADTVRQNPRFIGLGTMHPGLSLQAIRDEVRRLLSLGLKGIKLHPDFQSLYFDAEDMMPIYEQVLENGLCLVVHAGDHRHPYSHPARIAAVARRYPALPIVAAHMGGWSQWTIGHQLLEPLSNVLVDTSSTMRFIPVEEMMRLIGVFGTDRILFGSDYPMWDPSDELDRFLALPLGESEHKAILYDNAARFFHVDA